MVRVFLAERFTKKTMSVKVVEQALKLFDGPQTFSRSKVIHSTAVYMNKSDQLYTINVGESGSPRCKEDFWLLNFLRCYSDCIVTTGAILRKEPEAFNPNIPSMLGFDKNVYFKNKQKPLCILTNTLNKNFTHSNSVYEDSSFKKIVLTQP